MWYEFGSALDRSPTCKHLASPMDRRWQLVMSYRLYFNSIFEELHYETALLLVNVVAVFNYFRETPFSRTKLLTFEHDRPCNNKRLKQIINIMRPTRLEPAISRSWAEHAIASSTEVRWKPRTFCDIGDVLACYVNFDSCLLATGWIVRPNIFLYKYLKGILLSHEVWFQTLFPRPCPLLVSFGKISAPKKRNWTLVGDGCDYFLKINTFRIRFF